MTDTYTSGFVALIGRPNVGKSTLLNRILQQKVSIVSNKAQTTRNKILGVYTEPQRQIIFIDTPGIHKPKHKLGETMRKEALDAMKEVDAVVFMVPANEKSGPGDQYIIEKLKQVTVPVFLVINKTDTVPKEEILQIIDRYRKLYDFREIIPISALDGTQVEELLQAVGAAMPAGPQYFPEDMVTDRPERNIIAEIIREKLLHKTRDEIPHAIAVDIEEITKRDNGMLYVRAVILVERTGQKRIVIGAKGSVLRDVGAESRREVQNLLGSPVYLDLWVKVAPDWRNKERALKELGYV